MMQQNSLMLREVSQKDKHHMVSHVESKMNMAPMNLSTQYKKTHSHTEETHLCQRGGGGNGMGEAFWIIKCKLLHLEWISNEVLLYSIGN